MFWHCRVAGSIKNFRLFPTIVLLCFASTCSAQLVPVPGLAEPVHSPVHWVPVHYVDVASLPAAERCVLLSPKFCGGLATADPIAGAPVTSPDALPAAPQPSSSSRSWRVERVVKRFAQDQGTIYVSPFQRANVKWDVAYILGTTAIVATDRHTIGIVSRENEQISRNISDVGLYGTGATAGAIFITGLITDNAHARETGFLTGEALVNAYPVYVGLQLIAGRERPDQGAGHGRFFQNHSTNTSFPSGHAMFTWTMAAVIAHEYPRTWVKVLAYSTAAAVSVTRYTGREHFVGDVALGSFIGYFIGRHIFNMHCSPEFSERCLK
jgi:membrane-associated phospholipid phosphatase